jgi:hypothetical protein
MAKRVREDDAPYRPVEAALVRSVVDGPKKVAESNVLHFASPEAKSQEELGEETKTNSLLQTRFGLEPFDQLIRVLMSKSEKAALENLVDRLAKQADTTLKISHLMRAFVILLRNGEDMLLEEARRGTRLVRPSNGNPIGIADFEQRVARLLLASLKNVQSL